VLEALGLSKRAWYYSQKKRSYEEKYYHLRKPLLEIARDHPEYGCRRTTRELNERGYPVDKKVVEKLHRYWGLSVIKTVKRPRESAVRALLREAGCRIDLVAQLKDISDFDVLYTDFTEIRYQRGMAKAQLIPIIDHRSKLVLGHEIGDSANTQLALGAWKKTRSTLKRLAQKIEGTIIHHDQDGVFIGHRWLNQVMVKDKMQISFSLDGAKGNVYIESFNGRFKEENRLLFWEQEDLESLRKVVKSRMRYYNQVRKHSALDYKSPMKYLKEKGK